MPRFITIFLSVLALGSFTALAWMLARPTPPDPKVAKLETELQVLKKENAKLREQLDKRPSAAPVVTQSAPVAALPENPNNSAAGAPGAQGKGTGANLREMMSNPAMRAMMEQQQAMQIDMGYGKLMGILGLNDEEKAHFKKLLLEREKLQTDQALKLLDPNLTPEERQKLTQELQTRRQAYDGTIKAFLNNADDYKTFKHWEDTQPERLQFDMMGRSMFSSSGEPLSDQQEQQLIDLMAQVRKSPSAPADLADPAASDPTQLTQEKIDQYIQRLEQMHKSIEQQAGSILTPGQVQTLSSYLSQTRNLAVNGMNMSRLMIGGGK